MRLVRLSETSIVELFNSVASSPFIGSMIDVVIREMAINYSNFVHVTLTMHSGSYVKANSADSPINGPDLNRVVGSLKHFAPDLREENILVADKMDILYGTDYRTYCEYSKFSSLFYEHVFEVINNKIQENNLNCSPDEIFHEVIRGIEFMMSMIEQLVVFSSQDVDLDDTIVLCLVNRPDSLMFVML